MRNLSVIVGPYFGVYTRCRDSGVRSAEENHSFKCPPRTIATTVKIAADGSRHIVLWEVTAYGVGERFNSLQGDHLCSK